MNRTLTDFFFDALLKKHFNEEIFWTNIFEKKINLAENGEGTDWDKPNSKAYYKLLLADIKRWVGIPETATELGCGTGILSLLLAAEGTHVTLVDHLPDALKYARICEKRMREEFHFKGSVRYEQGDIMVSRPDWKADFVHNCGVIEEMSDDQIVSTISCMKEVSRSLVMVGVPNFYNPYLLGKFIDNGKGMERYFSQNSLKELMVKSDFKDVAAYSSSCIHPRLPPFINKPSPFGFLHLGIGSV